MSARIGKFSLVKWSRYTRTIAIHRLVQMVLCDEMSKSQKTSLQSSIVDLCDYVFPECTRETRRPCQAHLDQVFDPLLRITDICTLKSSDVKYKVGRFLHKDGKYVDSERIVTQAVEVRSKILGPDHLQTLRVRGIVSMVVFERGHYVDAIRLDRYIWRSVRQSSEMRIPKR